MDLYYVKIVLNYVMILYYNDDDAFLHEDDAIFYEDRALLCEDCA